MTLSIMHMYTLIIELVHMNKICKVNYLSVFHEHFSTWFDRFIIFVNATNC